ncbi:MAG: hypothetical protein COU51_03655 [Parcubacteria group bacterium CG10_big_fil_rev_8_21_14_0_10_36_14]|nr:MAG: hypothetical protein COU51_03655 [Parcubacteria group bacterium CG10_big_fil_rev_8_21_14_0_10_36_14]
MKKKKKKNKKNKFNFFLGRAKWLLSTVFFIVIISLAYIGAVANEVALGKDNANTVAYSVDNNVDEYIQLASSDLLKSYNPNLSRNIGVYIMSKKGGRCQDYRNTLKPGIFAFRCRTKNSIWRGFWTKKIDVKGYSKLQVQAVLGVKDYTGSSAGCTYSGVSREDAVDLIAFSTDPNIELSNECNHVVGDDLWWNHCLVANNDVGVIAHCGIPRCDASKSCNMTLDVAGKDVVYLTFAVHDDWFADIEGTLSNMEITLIK